MDFEFDFTARERNPNVTDEEADVFSALITKVTELGDVQVLARMAVACLRGMSAALHLRDGHDRCSEGCVHAQEFGYTLSMVLASGKAQRMLANMELSNTAMAAAYAIAVMTPDDHELSTPSAVLEDLASTFEEIEADDGWESYRRATRDALEMDAVMAEIQNLPEFGGLEL